MADSVHQDVGFTDLPFGKTANDRSGDPGMKRIVANRYLTGIARGGIVLAAGLAWCGVRLQALSHA